MERRQFFKALAGSSLLLSTNTETFVGDLFAFQDTADLSRVEARYYKKLPDREIECQLCPRDATPAAPAGRALEDLHFIRETMESAAAFTAVPGLGGVIIGVTALVAAFVAARQSSPLAWLLTWVVEGVLAFAVASGAMICGKPTSLATCQA
jgi:hypothetical protein